MRIPASCKVSQHGGGGVTDQALIMGNILVHGFAAFSRFYSVHYTESRIMGRAGGLVGVGRFSSIGQKIFINEFYSSSISWGFWSGAVFETTRATRRVG